MYARGLRRRKRMFGEADVEKRMTASGEFGAPLQNIINAYVYGDVWEREGLADDISRDARHNRREQSASGIPRSCRGRAGKRMHQATSAGRPAGGRDVLRRTRRNRNEPHCLRDLWRIFRLIRGLKVKTKSAQGSWHPIAVLATEHPLVERRGADCLVIMSRSFQARISRPRRFLQKRRSKEHRCRFQDEKGPIHYELNTRETALQRQR